MTKYFIDADGKYIGAFDGAEPPNGSIEVAEPPEHTSDVRTGNAWAKSLARQAAEAKAADIAQTKIEARSDAFVQRFVDMTPAQVITYVSANVSNLADAKQLLTKLALMLLVVAKEQYK